MRKSLLAMAALMGVATLPAHAWRVKVDEQTFANIGFSTQIWARHEGKRTNAATDHSATHFYMNLANINASGQVNKLVYFLINAESNSARGSFIVRDSFIGLKFADEFRVQAGYMRAPFSRVSLTSSYSFIVPTLATYAGARLSINPANVQGLGPDGSRDAGLVVWGTVGKDAPIKYYLGVFDGRFDRRSNFFGGNTKDQLGYTFRVQFTPTMLGFKGEPAYGLSDTYLGGRNVLSLGLGYRIVGVQTTGFNNNYTKDAKMFTVDMLYEQKFGDLVPNLQVGYTQAKDVAYQYVAPLVRYGEATQIYVQGQLLYDQVVGFGKPALAIRWEQNKNKDLKSFNTTTGATTAISGEPRNSRIGVFGHYYIKGQAARVSFGIDSVNFNTDAKGANGKNYADVTLHLQTQF